MESWFWILGWILSILTITGNGFIVLLVISQRKLRTKTNAFIVSLAVADFCVGAFAFPSLFFCEIRDGCNWPRPYASWVDFKRQLFAYASITNLCSLALDQYIYGCCEATKKSRHHDCAMCQLTSISSVIPLCLVIFALVMVLYLTFSSCRIVVRVFSALLEIFLSCMLQLVAQFTCDVRLFRFGETIQLTVRVKMASNIKYHCLF